jgi:hypothetical protein
VTVLVSRFPVRSGGPAELIERWLHREFELILSPRQFLEVLADDGGDKA